MIRILALYFDFEGAKKIHVQVQILGFGGHWGFLIMIWHHNLAWIWSSNSDTLILCIFAFYLNFEDAKNNFVL